MCESSKRRRLTGEEKLRILAEAQQPGVLIAEICRRHGIRTSQFYRWLVRACQAAVEIPMPSKTQQARNGWMRGTCRPRLKTGTPFRVRELVAAS